jgi:arginine decarboxylase-like protein
VLHLKNQSGLNCQHVPRCAGVIQVQARPPSASLRPWTPEDSSELYNIPGWGTPYFDVNSKGHLVVRPHGTGMPLHILSAATWCGLH